MSKRKQTDSSSKRNDLTLEQKVEVLTEVEKKTSYRTVSERFHIAIGTVTKIKNSKEQIENEAQNASNLQLKRPRRTEKYDAVNNCALEFFRRWLAINIPVTGVMLQEKPKFFADSRRILRNPRLR